MIASGERSESAASPPLAATSRASLDRRRKALQDEIHPKRVIPMPKAIAISATSAIRNHTAPMRPFPLHPGPVPKRMPRPTLSPISCAARHGKTYA